MMLCVRMCWRSDVLSLGMMVVCRDVMGGGIVLMRMWWCIMMRFSVCWMCVNDGCVRWCVRMRRKCV